MPSSESREAIRAGRRDVKAKFVAAPKAETSPLEDVEKQAEILEPKPLQATIGGELVEIHELAARYSRALTGLVQQVAIDLFQGPRGTDATFSTRLAALVAERYSDRMLPFIARSTAPAGEIPEADLPKMIADMDEAIRYDEMAKLLALLLTKNRVIEALTPRNGAAKKG